MTHWLLTIGIACVAMLQSDEGQPMAREHYKRAAMAMLAKNITLACSELTQLVEKFDSDPLAPLAALRLAECHLAQGNPKSAVSLLETWIPRLEDSARSQSLEPACYLRANMVLARAHLAADNLAEAITLAAEMRDAYTARGSLNAIETGLLDVLQVISEQANKRREQFQATHLRAAAEAIRNKSYDQAASELKRFDSKDLSPAWLWRYRILNAQCMLGQGNAASALVELDKIELATLEGPSSVAVRMACLDAAMALQDTSRAQKEIEALEPLVIADQRLGPSVALRAVETATLSKNRDLAKAKARAAKDLYPKFESIHEFDLLLAKNAIASIEFAEARRILQTILDRPPPHDLTAVPRAAWMIGESFFLAEDYPQAIAAYTIVIEDDRAPTWTETALMQRGKCHELVDDRLLAIADYERLLRDFGSSRFSLTAKRRLSEMGPVTRNASAPATVPKR